MRLRAVIVVAAVLAEGCGPSEQPSWPQPVPLPSTVDGGFPIKSRPGCAPEVVDAGHDASRIEAIAGHGAVFTCGPDSDPLPLDVAVLTGDVEVVRALLAAHADPNARWSSHGDRFPLQGAIEHPYGPLRAHRMRIIRLLLQHGADPNARWCPFESRAFADSSGCRLGGVTPLVMAAALDDSELAELLLDAGADYRLEDWAHETALNIAYSEKMLYLLLGAAFPEPKGRAAHALAYLTDRLPGFSESRPWQQTALARAIVGDVAVAPFPPPPPPPPPLPHRTEATKRDEHSFGADRTRVLLVLGADPNERLHAGAADWTPLALAVGIAGVDLVEMLLSYGADVNARWCAPVDFSRHAHVIAPAGCTIDTGTTPLMFAAMRGDGEIVALLLSRGGDRTLTDWRGRTPQWYAREAGFAQLAATLR